MQEEIESHNLWSNLKVLFKLKSIIHADIHPTGRVATLDAINDG